MRTTSTILALAAFASTLVTAIPNPGNSYPSPSYPSPPSSAPGYPTSGGSGGNGGGTGGYGGGSGGSGGSSGSGGSGGSGSSDPECGGSTSACCNESTVLGATIVTGCVRYSASSTICQNSANLYCCTTLLDTLCVLATGGS